MYTPPGYFSLLTTILTTNDSVYCVLSVWKLPAFNTVSTFYPDEEKQRTYLTSEV